MISKNRRNKSTAVTVAVKRWAHKCWWVGREVVHEHALGKSLPKDRTSTETIPAFPKSVLKTFALQV